MSTRMTARVLKGAVVALAVAALAVPAAAAQGPGGGHGGGGGQGGGGGGGTVEPTQNNLSVPAVFLGTNPYSLTCYEGTEIRDAQEPTGTPLDGYEEPGSYFVQGIHTWQAQCMTATAANVIAAWGDNLSGDARLKVGSPIRVEIGLTTEALMGLEGFDVIKLEASKLDRESAYGTLATSTDEGWVAHATDLLETRVWAQGATLKIWNPATGVIAYDGPASAEINSTGRVVYGYNLRVGEPGTWTIQYTFPGVSIEGTDEGNVSTDKTSVSMDITVVTGGGKKG